jgi:hypothetical protein
MALRTNVGGFPQLVLLIWNIESVLSAPPHMEVTVWERNFDGLGRVTTVGKLRRALEGSTYSADFGGCLFIVCATWSSKRRSAPKTAPRGA